MDHAKRFLEFVRSQSTEIDDDAIYNSLSSAAEAETVLFAYGEYLLDCTKMCEPELIAYPSTVIDYADLKNHYLQFVSEYQIGGRKYAVVLDETEYLHGKMAEDAMDFHNSTVAQIRSVIKNYHHILNHVRLDLDDKAYNPGDSLPAGGSLDEYGMNTPSS